MSYLQQLKRQAQARQAEQGEQQHGLEARTAATEAACQVVWNYLSELARQLSVIQPPAQRLGLDHKHLWPDMRQHDFRFDARKKRLRDREVFDYLALGWNPDEAPYEAFTLVNQAVEAAKHHPATRAQASFINGCLRRFLRERDALVAATDNDPVARFNHPAWWIQRLRKDHPQHWEQILRANNAHAPMTLRINQQKCTLQRYQKALNAINLEAFPAGGTGLALQHPVPVPSLPGFAEGWASVQDAAAQMAAPLLLQGLDLAQPLRVLDACAAPGGKTAHLLEMAAPGAPMHVTALEIDATRSARIEKYKPFIFKGIGMDEAWKLK